MLKKNDNYRKIFKNVFINKIFDTCLAAKIEGLICI